MKSAADIMELARQAVSGKDKLSRQLAANVLAATCIRAQEEVVLWRRAAMAIRGVIPGRKSEEAP